MLPEGYFLRMRAENPRPTKETPPLEMSHGVIKPFLGGKFPGGNTHLVLGFVQAGFWLRAPWWS